jgi:hypothetical protein
MGPASVFTIGAGQTGKKESKDDFLLFVRTGARVVSGDCLRLFRAGVPMTEPTLKRFFLEFVARDQVYQLVDRQTGQAGARYEDYTAALRALDVANREHEDAEARARASGRPL